MCLLSRSPLPQLLTILLVVLSSTTIIYNVSYAQQERTNRTLENFQKELHKRVLRDQAVRKALIKFTSRAKQLNSTESDQKKLNRLMKRASDTDDKNLVWLKKHISKHGFPAVSRIGVKAADEFFLLVLHADRDRVFQKECLEQMKQMPDEWASSYCQLLKLRIGRPSSRTREPPKNRNTLDWRI